jgi:HK97 family phage major capsid protein
VAKAKVILHAAEAADRGLSPDEEKSFNEHKTRAERLVKQAQQAKADQGVLDQAKSLAEELGVFPAEGVAPAGYIGAKASTGSGRHRGLQLDGKTRIAAPMLAYDDQQARDLFEAATSRKSLRVHAKAALTSTDAAMARTPTVWLPPAEARREPTRVLDLLPTYNTNSPVVEYYKTTGTTAAAAVAEGAAKPESTLAYTQVIASATKVAHWIEVTDEVIKDYAGFLDVAEADMRAGLIAAENAELLSATAGAAHSWAGLLNTTGILTATGTAATALNALEQAITSLRTGASFAEADGIVMHPSDWSAIRRKKDSSGRYLATDPLAGEVDRLWGVPVVTTTTITAGTALVGAFQEAAAVFVRDPITVDVNNSGEAQFKSNKTLLRAEERLILAVPRPTCLVKLTGLAT